MFEDECACCRMPPEDQGACAADGMWKSCLAMLDTMSEQFVETNAITMNAVLGLAVFFRVRAIGVELPGALRGAVGGVGGAVGSREELGAVGSCGELRELWGAVGSCGELWAGMYRDTHTVDKSTRSAQHAAAVVARSCPCFSARQRVSVLLNASQRSPTPRWP